MGWVKTTVDEALGNKLITEKDLPVLTGCGCDKCKEMGAHIERLYVDSELRRAVSVYYLQHGAEGVPPSWGYSLLDLSGPAAVSYYATAFMDDVEYASWEGRMVGRLSSSKAVRNNAYYFTTSERFRKGRTEESITTASIVSREVVEKTGNRLCLTTWTDPDRAEADTMACLKIEGSEGVRIRVHDIREDTLTKVSMIVSLLSFYGNSLRISTPVHLMDMPEDARYLKTPVGINPAIPELADMEYMAEKSGIDKESAKEMVIPYVLKPLYSKGLSQWLREVLDKPLMDLLLAERKKNPRLMASLDSLGFKADAAPLSTMVKKEKGQCDCGAVGVLRCVECSQLACFGCLENGRCKFCRGE